MPHTRRAFVKTFTHAVFVITVCLLGQTAAHADEVQIIGFTNGCFHPCSPPSTSSQQTATFLGLTYNNSFFSGVTSNGFLGIGDTPQPPGTQNLNNLGSFSLNGDPHLYTGQAFSLRVTFTSPTGIVSGPNTVNFVATLTGSVTSNTVGGVFIHFNSPTQLFIFENSQGSGSFTFTVTDVNVIAGGLVPLTGNVTGFQRTVPEPATLLLLATGLAGAATHARRRRAGSRK